MGNTTNQACHPGFRLSKKHYAPHRNDYIQGTSGYDLLQAGGGNNTLRAGNGNNSITTLDNGNNTITDGGGNDQITTGNGNNLISGGGGQDLILAGNGNNQIYADTKIDLASVLANQKTALASGQKGSLIVAGDGNNTLIGGNGNDAIFTGTGNNTLVLGAGAVTVQGGVEVSRAYPGWSADTNTSDPFTTTYTEIIEESAPFTAPTPYHGNSGGTFNHAPLGVSNDTIFGGAGNSNLNDAVNDATYLNLLERRAA